MTAIASEDQQLSGRKRRRSAIEQDHSATAISQHLGRKTKRRCQVPQEANTAYYDSLSKVWLTPGALAEHNRRACCAKFSVGRGLHLCDEPRRLRSYSKQLRFFAENGGPDLRDLVGVSLAYGDVKMILISSLQYPEPSSLNSTAPIMLSNQTNSRTDSKSRTTLGDSTAKTTTSKTKKTSPYDRNFGQKLIDNGIYRDDHEFPDDRDPPRPNNENEILSRLQQPRLSLSPSKFSNKEFRTFKQTNSRALNEDAVMGDVLPLVQGTARIPSAKNLVFGNLEPLTDSNLADAKPDFYDEARPAQIGLPIRENLGTYIIPATLGQAPALPNFFTEAKGPDGSAAVAKRQACFDGALGARGVHKLRLFEADPTLAYDNNAYAITSTYHDGQLKMYTVHPTQSTDPKDSPEYHMTQLRSFAMTDAAERFREGASAFRNARDWAKEQRDGLVAAANTRVMGIPKETPSLEPSTHSVSQSTTYPDTPDSETSADELSQDVGRGSSLSNKRLKRELEKRSSNPDLKVRPKNSYSGASSRSRSRGRLSQRR